MRNTLLGYLQGGPNNNYFEVVQLLFLLLLLLENCHFFGLGNTALQMLNVLKWVFKSALDVFDFSYI